MVTSYNFFFQWQDLRVPLIQCIVTYYPPETIFSRSGAYIANVGIVTKFRFGH